MKLPSDELRSDARSDAGTRRGDEPKVCDGHARSVFNPANSPKRFAASFYAPEFWIAMSGLPTTTEDVKLVRQWLDLIAQSIGVAETTVQP